MPEPGAELSPDPLELLVSGLLDPPGVVATVVLPVEPPSAEGSGAPLLVPGGGELDVSPPELASDEEGPLAGDGVSTRIACQD